MGNAAQWDLLREVRIGGKGQLRNEIGFQGERYKEDLLPVKF